jgi:hypothetical protein
VNIKDMGWDGWGRWPGTFLTHKGKYEMFVDLETTSKVFIVGVRNIPKHEYSWGAWKSLYLWTGRLAGEVRCSH